VSANQHVASTWSSSAIPDEEDRDTCVVLGAFEIEILGQRVQLSIDHGVAVQKIEEVHDPKNRLEAMSELSLGIRIPML